MTLPYRERSSSVMYQLLPRSGKGVVRLLGESDTLPGLFVGHIDDYQDLLLSYCTDCVKLPIICIFCAIAGHSV